MSIEPVDIDRVEFRKVAEGTKLVPAVWDVIAPSGVAVARAEVFVGDEQWGVRLQDRAPQLNDADLLKIVRRLLVWGVACRVDTVDVVLCRTHAHHTLVRVGADFV